MSSLRLVCGREDESQNLNHCFRAWSNVTCLWEKNLRAAWLSNAYSFDIGLIQPAVIGLVRQPGNIG